MIRTDSSSDGGFSDTAPDAFGVTLQILESHHAMGLQVSLSDGTGHVIRLGTFNMQPTAAAEFARQLLDAAGTQHKLRSADPAVVQAGMAELLFRLAPAHTDTGGQCNAS